MGELKPTAARIALLQVVDRGEVVQYQWDEHRPSFWDKGWRGLCVTARIAELREADWVRLREIPGHHVFKWEVTDAGREVLNGNKERFAG